MASLHPRLIVVLLAALVAAAVGAGPAHAASDRITRSEAKAIFRTFTPGEFQATIRPFAGSPWDGAHFCAQDWHVAVVGTIRGGDASFTKQDAAASLGAVSVSFVLNGAPLASERTRIKAYPDPSQFGWINAYYVQDGRLLAPQDLAVGQHALQVAITESGVTVIDGITFFIDAAGTGACL